MFTRFGGGEAFYDLCVAFGMLAFATFVYDTLDVSTRLGRYILQELTGWRSAAGGAFATVLTLGPAVAALVVAPIMGGPGAAPSWQKIWPVFGSSNQLLAALTMLGVTAWLVRARVKLLAIALPMVFMLVMTTWALWLQALPMLRAVASGQPIVDPNGVIATVLLVLAALIVVEVLRARGRIGDAQPASLHPGTAAAVQPTKAASLSN